MRTCFYGVSANKGIFCILLFDNLYTHYILHVCIYTLYHCSSASSYRSNFLFWPPTICDSFDHFYRMCKCTRQKVGQTKWQNMKNFRTQKFLDLAARKCTASCGSGGSISNLPMHEKRRNFQPAAIFLAA